MKVLELVNMFKEENVQNTKIAPNAVKEWICSVIEIKSYLPFAEKKKLCASVVEESCKKENGAIVVDSVKRYITFTTSIISKYTNIEFNSDENADSLDDYDMLCEAGLLDEILDILGTEYVKCNNLLNMMVKDVIDNNSTEAIIGRFLNMLYDKVEEFTDILSYKVDSLNLDLNQIDIDKYKPLLEKLGGIG